ncbi:MAG: hypothetical protein KC439_00230 [Yoonia sp.]|jgi:hypothetical protein|nr:hypothetical protein [Yoonia sp.]
MLDISARIAQLRRPSLLIKAARFGLDEYTRDVHLRRILKTDSIPRPAPAVMQLLDVESAINTARIEKQATYSVARHVDVMIALMAEAQILRATTRPT